MPVDQLIELLKSCPEIRTKSRIADVCGVTIQAVRCWRRIPAEHCRTLEYVTNGKVTRHAMRPDVFGPTPGDDSDVIHRLESRSVA